MPLTRQEEKILKSIVVPSENDPSAPEFPPSKPRFPATPTYRIKIPGFTNVWLKDESVNPTGTHKDRMAWEIVVTYRTFLLAKKRGRGNGTILPTQFRLSFQTEIWNPDIKNKQKNRFSFGFLDSEPRAGMTAESEFE